MNSAISYWLLKSTTPFYGIDTAYKLHKKLTFFKCITILLFANCNLRIICSFCNISCHFLRILIGRMVCFRDVPFKGSTIVRHRKNNQLLSFLTLSPYCHACKLVPLREKQQCFSSFTCGNFKHFDYISLMFLLSVRCSGVTIRIFSSRYRKLGQSERWKHMDDATKWNKGSGLIQVVPNTANTQQSSTCNQQKEKNGGGSIYQGCFFCWGALLMKSLRYFL